MSVKFTDPEIKNLVYDLICFGDELNEKGQRLPRSTFNKKHFKGSQGIKQKILNQIKLRVVSKADKISEIQIVSQPEYKPDPLKRIVSENHTLEAEIELNERELESLKYYYDEREELISISAEAFEEFEKMLEGVK